MMTKIGNMQKIMISLDIFAEEKSFLNWPENLPLKYQALVSGERDPLAHGAIAHEPDSTQKIEHNSR